MEMMMIIMTFIQSLLIKNYNDKDNNNGDVYRTPLRAAGVLSAGEGLVASRHFRGVALTQKTPGKTGKKGRGRKVSYT